MFYYEKNFELFVLLVVVFCSNKEKRGKKKEKKCVLRIPKSFLNWTAVLSGPLLLVGLD